jgi:glutamine cyclotransferase
MAVAYFMTSRRMDFLGQNPSDYSGTGPHFDMREYLNGPLQCEGMIYGPTGRVTSRFVADMDVTWTGNVGIMKERFHYDSGTIQDRQWTLTIGNDGAIKAEADDLIGIGRGMQEGSALELKYRIKLPESAGGHELDAVDWMYLIENGTIMNRSQFRKYGIKVAELVATMRRKEAA